MLAPMKTAPRTGIGSLHGDRNQSGIQSIVWPVLLLVLLVWLEGQNRKSSGFFGGL